MIDPTHLAPLTPCHFHHTPGASMVPATSSRAVFEQEAPNARF